MEMIGRRVATFDDLERAGDYCGPVDEVNDKDEVIGRGLWFLLPIHEGVDKYDRATRGSGLHRISEPPWTFTEQPEDGSLHVEPSIACGRSEKEGEYFHGFLSRGHRWTW